MAGRIDPASLETQLNTYMSQTQAARQQAIAQRQPTAPPANIGPTSKWARFAQVGASLKQKADALLQFGKQYELPAAKKVVGNEFNFAKDVGSDLLHGPITLAQMTKSGVQPAVKAAKQLVHTSPRQLAVNTIKGGTPEVLAARQQLQQNVKSGKITPAIAKFTRQAGDIDMDQYIPDVNKLVAQGKSQKQIIDYLQGKIDKTGKSSEKAAGAAAETYALLSGGGNLVKGGEAIARGSIKIGLKNLGRGFVKEFPTNAFGSAGGKIADNPTSSVKDIATTALVGGASASGAGTGGRVITRLGNKVLSKVAGKTVTGVEEQVAKEIGRKIPVSDLSKTVEGKVSKVLPKAVNVAVAGAKPSSKGYSDAAFRTLTKPIAEAAAKVESPELNAKVIKPKTSKVSIPLVNKNKPAAKGVGSLVNKASDKTGLAGIFNPEQSLYRAGHTEAATIVREIASKQNLAAYRSQFVRKQAERLGLDKQSYEEVAKNIESGNIKDAAHQHFVDTVRGTGERSVKAGTIESARGPNYAPRYVKYNDKSGGSAIGGLRKSGGFSKQRVQAGEFGLGGDKYKTYAEFKKAVTDSGGKLPKAKPSEILAHTFMSREKAIANSEGLSKLDKAAMADGRPATVGFSQAKGLSSKYAGYNTDLIPGRAVHPDLVPAIKSLMIDSGANKLVRGIGKVSSFTKRLITINGVIHDLNFGRSSLGEQGLLRTTRSALPQDIISRGLKNPKYAADTERSIQNGVVYSAFGRTNIYDEANNGANSLGRKANSVLGKLRGGMDKAVFGIGDHMGRSTYLSLEKGYLKHGFTQQEAGQLAAEAANRVMFTQRASESSSEMRAIGKIMLFAKNFFHSTLQKATTATGISRNTSLSNRAQHAEQLQAAKALARTFGYLFAGGQALNYATTGHSTFQNKGSKLSPVFYVDKTTGKEYHITNWYGQVGELMNLTDPKWLISRFAPGVQEAVRIISNQDQPGYPASAPVRNTSASGVRQWGEIAANVLEHMVTPGGIDTTRFQQMFGPGHQPAAVTAATFLGFGASSTDQNPMEKDIMNQFYATLPQGAPKTPPQTSLLEARARNDIAQGKTNSPNLQALKSQMSAKAYRAFVKTGGDNSVQRAFDKLPTDQKFKLIEKYSPQQLKELDFTGVEKSLVDSSSRSTIQALQAKGVSTQQVQQDLNKIGATSGQLSQLKAEAKKQAKISSAKARHAPKFKNPFVR